MTPPKSLCACQDINEVLSRIGDRWSVLTIYMLANGKRRFNELKRDMGISQRMLSLTLRGLERDGLVIRHYYPTIPPKVEYELSELGHSMRKPVRALADWALASLPEINEARAVYDERAQRAEAAE